MMRKLYILLILFSIACGIGALYQIITTPIPYHLTVQGRLDRAFEDFKEQLNQGR